MVMSGQHWHNHTGDPRFERRGCQGIWVEQPSVDSVNRDIPILKVAFGVKTFKRLGILS